MGTERFRTLPRSHFRGAHCVLLLYNTNDQESFARVRYYYEEAQRGLEDNDYTIVLVGHTFGGVRAVTHEEGSALARELEVPFVEVNTNTGENVDELFDQASLWIFERMIRKFREHPDQHRSVAVRPFPGGARVEKKGWWRQVFG